MDKITTLSDLENLSKFIPEVDSRSSTLVREFYENYPAKKFSLNPLTYFQYVGQRENECCDIRKREYLHLPSSMIIGPELAYFLAEDQTKFDMKIKDSEKGLLPAFIIAMGNIALLGINPGIHTAVGIGGGFHSLIKKSINTTHEYYRILEERDQLATCILGKYKLSEIHGGLYKLQLGKWEVQKPEHDMEPYPVFIDFGLDKGLNMDRLRSTIEKKSRGEEKGK